MIELPRKDYAVFLFGTWWLCVKVSIEDDILVWELEHLTDVVVKNIGLRYPAAL